MIDKDILEKTLAESGFSAYNTIMDFSCDYPFIEFKNSSLSDFLHFAKQNNITTIFYMLYYYYQDEYALDISAFNDGQSHTIISSLSDEIKEYNELVSTVNFSRPKAYRVYCLYEGHIICTTQEDRWIDQLGIIPVDEKWNRLFETHASAIEKIASDIENDRLAMRDEMKRIILADDAFYTCTNHQRRRNYLTVF